MPLLAFFDRISFGLAEGVSSLCPREATGEFSEFLQFLILKLLDVQNNRSSKDKENMRGKSNYNYSNFCKQCANITRHSVLTHNFPRRASKHEAMSIMKNGAIASILIKLTLPLVNNNEK